MQAEAAQRAKQFQTQIEQSRSDTAASVKAADEARLQAQAQMTQQQAQSNLMIHQQQLQSAIARQQKGSPVSKVRRTAKRGTPESMRTKLSIDSGLGATGGGDPDGVSTRSLNV